MNSLEVGPITERELRVAFRIGLALFLISLFLFLQFRHLDRTIQASTGKIVGVLGESTYARNPRKEVLVSYQVHGREYRKKLIVPTDPDLTEEIRLYYYPAYPDFPWYGKEANGIVYVIGMVLVLSGMLVLLARPSEKKQAEPQNRFENDPLLAKRNSHSD